jgi:DNA-binding transcriptional ArsR family regulator
MAVVQILQTAERAQLVLQPLRLRILELLAEPGSATTVATALGLPRQQVNYHLRELERANVVELVEERRKGNCTERVYRSIGRSFVVAPSAFGGVGPAASQVRDRASSDYLVALGARLIEDLSELRQRGGPVPTLAIETEVRFESGQARGEYAKELAQAVAGLARKYHHEGGRDAYRVVVAAHPSAGNLEGTV